jgi:hypothetical protein
MVPVSALKCIIVVQLGPVSERVMLFVHPALTDTFQAVMLVLVTSEDCPHTIFVVLSPSQMSIC